MGDGLMAILFTQGPSDLPALAREQTLGMTKWFPGSLPAEIKQLQPRRDITVFYAGGCEEGADDLAAPSSSREQVSRVVPRG
jgi:hypothetical protein